MSHNPETEDRLRNLPDSLKRELLSFIEFSTRPISDDEDPASEVEASLALKRAFSERPRH